MQNKYINFLLGSVNILIEGLSIEKFINMAVSKNLYLRNLQRPSHTQLIATVSIRGFLTLRPIAKRLKLKIKIINKNGYPFIYHKAKKRKMFAFGMLLCVAFLFFMSSFIWVVNITGNKTIKTDEIMSVLSKNGVKPGILKFSVDKSKVEKKLMISIDKLAWVGISINGTKATVYVVEKKQPAKIIKNSEPTNIVASKDAVVDKIITLQGDAAVPDGTNVKAGQILVNGIIQREGVGTRYVHSYAIIRARTWYEATYSVPLKEYKYVPTGRILKEYSLDFNDKNYKLLPRKIPYKYYDIHATSTDLFNINGIRFPVSFVTKQYKETKLITNELSSEKALALSQKNAYEKAYKKLPKNAIIVNKKVEYSKISSGIATSKILIVASEDIGKEERILVEEDTVDKGNNNKN